MNVNPLFGTPSQMPGPFGQLTPLGLPNVVVAWASQQFQPVMPTPVPSEAQMGIPMQSNNDWADRVPQHQPATVSAPGGATPWQAESMQPPTNTRDSAKLQLPVFPSVRNDAARLRSTYTAFGLAWKHGEMRVTAPTFRSSMCVAADSDQFLQLRVSQLSLEFVDFPLYLVARLRPDTRVADLDVVTKLETRSVRREYEIGFA